MTVTALAEPPLAAGNIRPAAHAWRQTPGRGLASHAAPSGSAAGWGSNAMAVMVPPPPQFTRLFFKPTNFGTLTAAHDSHSSNTEVPPPTNPPTTDTHGALWGDNSQNTARPHGRPRGQAPGARGDVARPVLQTGSPEHRLRSLLR